MRPSRWPIRARLTALYAGSFLAAGIVLVAVTYVLTAQSLGRPNRGTPPISQLTDEMLSEADLEQARQAINDALEEYQRETLNSLLTWSIIALLAALLLAAGLGWLLAGRALAPLQQVTDTARRVADRSLHERIAMTGPKDEVKSLADTIDAMLERLDRSFDAQRRFVANASHELRTPLAVNRTLLEVALGDPEISADLRRLAPTVLATNERSERLVEGLLTLAQSDQAITDRRPVDLREIAEVAIRQEEREAADRQVKLTSRLRPAAVSGNAVLLERLAANLVRNAVRHSGSDAIASVTTDQTEDSAILAVTNSGRTIQPYEIDGMFEPFRPGKERLAGADGVGLGLSIVRSVAIALGGTATASPRAGGGLVVRVELPISDSGSK